MKMLEPLPLLLMKFVNVKIKRNAFIWIAPIMLYLSTNLPVINNTSKASLNCTVESLDRITWRLINIEPAIFLVQWCAKIPISWRIRPYVLYKYLQATSFKINDWLIDPTWCRTDDWKCPRFTVHQILSMMINENITIFEFFAFIRIRATLFQRK